VERLPGVSGFGDALEIIFPAFVAIIILIRFWVRALVIDAICAGVPPPPSKAIILETKQLGPDLRCKILIPDGLINKISGINQLSGMHAVFRSEKGQGQA
jgi:hypothetical protein